MDAKNRGPSEMAHSGVAKYNNGLKQTNGNEKI